MKTSPRAICGWIGIVAGMLSLAFALLPAKLAPVITPPKPIEQSIVDRAKALRDRAVALIRGAEERPSAIPQPSTTFGAP